MAPDPVNPSADTRPRPEGLDELLARRDEKNLYVRLGVRVGATVEEIEKATTALVRRFHPDRWHTSPHRADCERATSLITGTAEILCDPGKYQIYCLRNNIAIDRYPSPAGKHIKLGAASLDGEQIGSGLSLHVASTDPHLYYDTQALLKAMRVASERGYADESKLFEGLLSEGRDVLMDDRCIRAARQPKSQELFPKVAEHNIAAGLPFAKLERLLTIFGFSMARFAPQIERAIERRIVELRIDSRTISECLMLRRALPQSFDKLSQHSEVQKRLKPKSSASGAHFLFTAFRLVFSRNLTSEEIAVSLYDACESPAQGVGAGEVGQVLCEALRGVHNPQAFCSTDAGRKLIRRIVEERLPVRAALGLQPILSMSDANGEVERTIPKPGKACGELAKELLEKIYILNDGRFYHDIVDTSIVLDNLGYSLYNPLPSRYTTPKVLAAFDAEVLAQFASPQDLHFIQHAQKALQMLGRIELLLPGIADRFGGLLAGTKNDLSSMIVLMFTFFPELARFQVVRAAIAGNSSASENSRTRIERFLRIAEDEGLIA